MAATAGEGEVSFLNGDAQYDDADTGGPYLGAERPRAPQVRSFQKVPSKSHKLDAGSPRKRAGYGALGEAGDGLSGSLLSCSVAAKGVDTAAQQKLRLKLWLALVLCTLFMFAELVGGIISSSLAIVTDAAHLLADGSSFAIALLAARLASRRGGPSSTYGYHRAEVLSAVASCFLVWLVTALLLYEAAERLADPVDVNGKLMFFLALGGVGVNVLMVAILGHDHCHGHHHGHGHAHGHDCSTAHAQSGSKEQTGAAKVRSANGWWQQLRGGGGPNAAQLEVLVPAGTEDSAAVGPAMEAGIAAGPLQPQRGLFGWLGRRPSRPLHDAPGGGVELPALGTALPAAPGSHSLPSGPEEAVSLPLAAILGMGAQQEGEQGDAGLGYAAAQGEANGCSEVAVCIATALDGEGADGKEAFEVDAGGAQGAAAAAALLAPARVRHSGRNANAAVWQSAPTQSPDGKARCATAGCCNDSEDSRSAAQEGCGQAHGGSINLRGAIVHAISDVLQSVGVAIAGGLIWWNQDDPRWRIADPLCTFFFSFLVLATTMPLLRDCGRLLMERSPAHIDAAAIGQGLLQVEGVASAHCLHVWALTPGVLLLSVHVHGKHGARQAALLQRLQQYCSSKGVAHATIQLMEYGDSCPCQASATGKLQGATSLNGPEAV